MRGPAPGALLSKVDSGLSKSQRILSLKRCWRLSVGSEGSFPMGSSNHPQHEVLLGLLASAGASLTFVALVIFSEWLERQEWPAFGMLGIACWAVTGTLLIQLRYQRQVNWPSSSNQKVWLFARGFASVFSLGCQVLATFFGCPAGDAMAISSTNVFASAVAGSFLFKERFGRWKVASLFATLVGAVLVSKPARLGTLGAPRTCLSCSN